MDKIPEGVPVEKVEHRLSEKELICPKCGGTMVEIGKEISHRLKIIPARVVVLENEYYTYACRHCSEENIETPMKKVL